MSLVEYALPHAGSSYLRWAAGQAGPLGDALLRHEGWLQGSAATALPAGAPQDQVDNLENLQSGAPRGFAAPSMDAFNWLVARIDQEAQSPSDVIVVYGAYAQGDTAEVGASCFGEGGLDYLALPAGSGEAAVRAVLLQADNPGVMLGAVGPLPDSDPQLDPEAFLEGFARTARVVFATAYDIDGYMLVTGRAST